MPEQVPKGARTPKAQSSQGQTGSRGDQGNQGDQGDQGERGRQGDHGQNGHDGRQGERGVPGHAFSRVQTVTMFVFVVLVFTLLAWRNQLNSDATHRTEALLRTAQAQIRVNQDEIRANDLLACRVTNGNVIRLNNFIDTIIVSASKTPGLSPTERARRIASYQAAKGTIAVCK